MDQVNPIYTVLLLWSISGSPQSPVPMSSLFLEGAYAELPQILLNFCFRPSSFGLPFPDIHVIDSLQLHVYKERSSIGSPIMTFIYGANTSNHPGYLNWSSLVS
jgi:hypothetical protein